MKRSRTFTWEDPLKGAEQARLLDGEAYLHAMENGDLPLPPVMNALGMKATGFEKGRAVFSFQPQEFHYNPIGRVHGGIITTILDSAMGCSLHSLLPAGTGYTTLELKVNFLKAVNINCGELKATGKVIHNGSRTALVEAQLTDDKDVVYAHAVSTCMIMKF